LPTHLADHIRSQQRHHHGIGFCESIAHSRIVALAFGLIVRQNDDRFTRIAPSFATDVRSCVEHATGDVSSAVKVFLLQDVIELSGLSEGIARQPQTNAGRSVKDHDSDSIALSKNA